jgi:hypothetical protein
MEFPMDEEVLISEGEETLLSECFAEGCETAAKQSPKMRGETGETVAKH